MDTDNKKRKYCSSCGAQYDDDTELFCNNCDAIQIEIPDNTVQCDVDENSQKDKYQGVQQQFDAHPNSLKVALQILLPVIALVVIFAIGVYFLFFTNTNSRLNGDEQPSISEPYNHNNETEETTDEDDYDNPDEPDYIIVEDVLGLDWASAVRILTDQGFSVVVEEGYHIRTVVGSISSQRPLAGAHVDKESTISLVTSLGPGPTRLEFDFEGLFRSYGTIVIEEGETIRLSAIVTPADTLGDISWTASDMLPISFTLSDDGRSIDIKGHRQGFSQIHASMGAFQISVSISVKRPVPTPDAGLP